VKIINPMNGDILAYNSTSGLWENISAGGGITSLNGLTPAVQTFATGSSGTDFNISSATATHTFNIPTASATNRGLLSSSDWSAFDGKQPQLNGTGFVKASGTTITYDNTTYYPNSNPSNFIDLTDLSAGTGISYDNTTGVITNAAPDQVVSLTGSGTTTISGTYPNFTISSADQFTGTVTSVDISVPTGLTVSGNPITSAGTLAIALASGYVIPTQTTLDGKVPYTGATANVNLGAFDLSADVISGNTGSFTSNGSSDTFAITHSSGSGKALNISKGGNGEGLTVVKTSGSGNAASITGGITLLTTLNLTNALADTYIASSANWNTAYNNRITALTTTGNSGAATLASNTLNVPEYTLSGLGGVPSTRSITINGTAFDLSADRTYSVGTVTDVAALTLGTTGTDVSSTVANGTTTPVITLNIPTASATNRGALSSTDWSTFNAKEPAITAGTSSQYYRGDKTFQTLNTAAVAEQTNLYFTEDRVRGTVLTGLNLASGGTIAATDSVLQAFGKVQNQISALVGGVIYKGTWNASTNTPTLASGTGAKGDYYIVTVDGTTNLDGITDWKVGDWAIFNGTTWDKVDNTDAVSSVNGYTGAVSLVTGDVLEGSGSLPSRPSQLYFTDARARLALSAGTGISYDNTTGVITNASPDQTVALTGAGTTSISGTYPNFTITSNDQFVGTVTSVGTSAPLTGGTITTTGTIGITQSSSVADGYLSSTDWNTFNGKQAALNGTGFVKISGTTISYDNSTYLTTSSAASTYVPLTRTLTINGTALDLSADRSFSVGTVTSVAALTIGTTGTDITSTVANGTTTPVITLNIPTASASNRGALSSTDWTTFNNKQNALTNPVTGTGTTNYIPKFTGASTIGNSLLFDNGVNIGIGTTSPTNFTPFGFGPNLEISGGGGGGFVSSNSDSSIKMIMQVSNSSNTGTLKTLTNHALTFATNDVTRMGLDTSGNLGLGVTPSASSVKTFEIGAVGNTLTGFGGGDIALMSNAYFDSGFKYAGANLAASYRIQDGVHKWNVAPSGTAGNAITFTQAMTLDASGNLGLNQSSPTNYTGFTTLHVNGKSGSNGGVLRLTAFDNTSSFNIYAAGSAANFNTTSSIPFIFLTNDTERLRITSGGNVGIGASTNPQNLLEVSSAGGSPRIRVGTLQNNDNTPRFEAITSNGVSIANSAWLKVNDAGGFTLGQSDYTKSGGDSGNFANLSAEVEYPRITVSSTGAATFSSSVQTGAPSGGTAKPIKFGAVQAASSLTGEALQVEVDGVVYLLGIVGSP
jgi:hypothetical protein